LREKSRNKAAIYVPSETETTSIEDKHTKPTTTRLKEAAQTLVVLFSSKGAQEGYLAAVDQGVISLSNFLATIILARNVDPTQLGIYGVGFVTLRLVRSIQDGVIVQPLNVFGASMDETSFKRYATSTSILQILLATATALAVAIAGWVVTRLGNDVAGPTLYSLWFAFLGWQLQEYIRRVLYTRGFVLSAVINTILANFVRLTLMLYWVQIGELTGIAGLQAIAWGAIVALIPGLWFTRNYWTRNYQSLKETWQRNWGFGRWLMGGTIANWISVEFYPVLTAGMISFAAAGAYRALQNLVAPIHALLRATDTFFTPRAARIFSSSGERALSRSLRLVYVATGIPTLGFLALAMIFPEQLLHLLYGDTYVSYSPAMVLMAIFYALWFAYWPLQMALKAVQVSRPIFAANVIAIILMFTVGIWMIQRWGVYGTIAGQALNALVVNVILWSAWYLFRRNP
jgi:O-antigen/teichoic acid export membrane protein